MKLIVTAILIAITSVVGYGQAITIDTTRTTMVITEKTGAVVRTLSIYRSIVAGSGFRHQGIYQPTAAEFGTESEVLKLNFTDEMTHLKKMIEAANKIRPHNFSKISMNILPYNELVLKLVNYFEKSPEWNSHLKSNPNLKRATTLFDGSQISEVAYNYRIAGDLLDRSDYVTDVSAAFATLGYTAKSGGFPEEHQRIISADKLMLLGKNASLFIPEPNMYFNLTKIK
jgi:hypothetical protein